MRLLQQFKARYCGTGLASFWHRWAPPIILSRKFYGATVFMDLRDNIDDLTRSRSELENREGVVLGFAAAVDGMVWDVGANVGLFSVRAVTLGRPCVAFELSPKACGLMEKTKSRSNMAFEIVNRAFTVKPTKYSPPVSSSAENRLLPSVDGEVKSCTYLAAAEEFGLPRLIKMDIEGGEEAFFQSPDYKEWLLRHKIAWLVEVHKRQLGYEPEWDDVPHRGLSDDHVLYAASEAEIGRLTGRMQAMAAGRA